ncbi:hypothetical protein B0O99DRAFT_675257 [Bisporella sp. PMI_857]|nr:hypothetical protein B0O99DRAFT_675257 [Bisporella sp. PMI_857]
MLSTSLRVLFINRFRFVAAIFTCSGEQTIFAPGEGAFPPEGNLESYLAGGRSFKRCYLQNENEPTVDPRSIFHKSPHVLDPPTESVSKDQELESLADDTWGEADSEPRKEPHDVSTDRSCDRGKSVSDASQYVADESVVRNVSFLSNYSVNNEEGGRAAAAALLLQPITAALMISEPLTRSIISSTSSASVSDKVGTNGCFSTLSNGHFKCPSCPRTYSNLGKARRHVQIYNHIHHCQVLGCSWVYDHHKDLVRHIKRHDPYTRHYECPVQDCHVKTGRHSNIGSQSSFTRKDLLKRHLERFH